MSRPVMDAAQQALELALGSGADDASAAASEGQATDYAYRDGSVEKVQESASRALRLRVYVEGRYSAHGTNDLRPDALESFVAEAVALTRELEPDPHRVLPDPALYAGRPDLDLDLTDPAVTDIEPKLGLGWLEAMNEVAHQDARVLSATSYLEYGYGRSARVTSNGFSGEQEGSSLWYGSVVTLDEGEGRRPEAYRFVGGRHLNDLPGHETVARTALERAQAHLGARRVESAKTNMVVEPEAAASLLGRLLGPLAAGAIQQERSFLARKKGEAIATPLLNILDLPLIPRGMGSRHFDGEGISARDLPLIEGGVLKNFYVDTYYGRKLGWEPTTGSASNIVVQPGRGSTVDLAAQVGDGFWVCSWLGGNMDPTSGDFSLGMRGFRIEGGKRAAPVSEMNVTGNMLDLMGKLIALGDDARPWTSLRSPSLAFENVSFGGS